MGRGYQAICMDCSTTVEVNDGPGMSAMPFRCEGCGKWGSGYQAFELDVPKTVEGKRAPGSRSAPCRHEEGEREWGWRCGPGERRGKEQDPPAGECGGRFTSEARARCPKCRWTEL